MKNKNTERVFSRITFVLLCFILIALLIPTFLGGYFSIHSQKKHYAVMLEQERSRLLATLSVTLAAPLWNVRVDQMEEIILSFTDLPYLLEVVVVDKITGETAYTKRRADFEQHSNLLYSSADIKNHEKVIGEVKIICSSDYYDRLLKDDVRQLVILFLCLFLLTSFLICGVIFQFMLKPLLELIQQSLKTTGDTPETEGWYTPIEKVQAKIVFLLNEFERYYQIVDHNVITLRLNNNGYIITSSEAFQNLFGIKWDNSCMIEGSHPLFPGKTFADRFAQGVKEAENRGEWKEETCWLAENGEEIWLNCRITAETQQGGTGFVIVCENVSDKKLIEQIAVTDKLTGLFNRVRIDEQLLLHMELFRRYANPFSLIMLDIDHFKAVNDTYGHQVGDRVLQELAGILQNNSRKTDIAGRFGGEEFVLICPGTPAEKARQLAESLRVKIEKFLFADELSITSSFGVGEFTVHDKDVESFLMRVDAALYDSKTGGRNMVSLDETFSDLHC